MSDSNKSKLGIASEGWWQAKLALRCGNVILCAYVAAALSFLLIGDKELDTEQRGGWSNQAKSEGTKSMLSKQGGGGMGEDGCWPAKMYLQHHVSAEDAVEHPVH